GTSICSRAYSTVPFAEQNIRVLHTMALVRIKGVGTALVSGLQVDRVGERGPCKIAPDVLHDQPCLALPEPRRHGGDMGAEEYARMTPERVARRERLRGEDIQRGAEETRGVQEVEHGRFIQERPGRD